MNEVISGSAGYECAERRWTQRGKVRKRVTRATQELGNKGCAKGQQGLQEDRATRAVQRWGDKGRAKTGQQCGPHKDGAARATQRQADKARSAVVVRLNCFQLEVEEALG